jgi:hypothetical protein
MSLHAFEAMRIPISGLYLAPSIHGFNNGLIEPYVSISLPIIFIKVDSFSPEHILFNILDFDLT